MPIQIPLGIFVDRVESSCRSFNLQAHLSHFLASDQRCISVDPHRLVDTFGLALELLNSTLGCSSFFYQSFCSNCTAYRGGSFAQSIMQHASSKCGAVFAAHMHPKI